MHSDNTYNIFDLNCTMRARMTGFPSHIPDGCLSANLQPALVGGQVGGLAGRAEGMIGPG